MLKNFLLLLILLVSYNLVSQTLYTPNISNSGVTYTVSVKSDTTSFSQQRPWDFSLVPQQHQMKIFKSCQYPHLQLEAITQMLAM